MKILGLVALPIFANHFLPGGGKFLGHHVFDGDVVIDENLFVFILVLDGCEEVFTEAHLMIKIFFAKSNFEFGVSGEFVAGVELGEETDNGIEIVFFVFLLAEDTAIEADIEAAKGI